MRQHIFLFAVISLLFPYSQAQITIKGSVEDYREKSLPGVNLMIQGSFDGGTTDSLGMFRFSTRHTGEQTLIISFIGYGSRQIILNLQKDTLLSPIKLRADSRELGAVVITAGTFEAGDQRKSVTLRPLDIVTTPSAAGDIYGMLSSLPGAANVGEDGRLFVRGGDGYESKTFIDGMMVRKPYSSSTPDLPSRGRFSPFLFSGTTFSTGGYSAEYGQALSSALLLNTNSFPEHTQTELSLMAIGMGISQTFSKDNYALSMGLDYNNLEPYFSLVPQTHSWNHYPKSLSGTFSGHLKTKNQGVMKFFSTYSESQSGLEYPDLSASPGAMQDIALSNQNTYSQMTYVQNYKDWIIQGGISLGYDIDSLDMKSFSMREYYLSAQARMSMSRELSDYFKIKTGTEAPVTNYAFTYKEKPGEFLFESAFTELLPAVFAEAESRPFARLAMRMGLRHEYSSILQQHATAWRASAAWLFNRDWQASLAAGSFFQTPEEDVLRYSQNLGFEKAIHYIANIQYEKQNRIFRAELYRKDYSHLIRFEKNQFFNPQVYNNTGEGYAQGIDIFFRDRESLRFLDYWISYSYVDAKRIYRSYPEKVRPHFSPEHSLTIVGKHWFQSISTYVGATFSVASGRPYHNPNQAAFMSEYTQSYKDISINASYLFKILGQQTVLHLSMSNVLGSDNIFGYRYYAQANHEGNYTALPIGPTAKRFLFAGLFLTIQ